MGRHRVSKGNAIEIGKRATDPTTVNSTKPLSPPNTSPPSTPTQVPIAASPPSTPHPALLEARVVVARTLVVGSAPQAVAADPKVGSFSAGPCWKTNVEEGMWCLGMETLKTSCARRPMWSVDDRLIFAAGSLITGDDRSKAVEGIS